MRDEKVIASICSRDERMMEYVIEKYSKLLWRIVYAVLKNTGSVQDVEECVADVFIFLWEHPDKFDPKRGELKTWLSIKARTHAIDCYRVLTQHQMVSLQDVALTHRAGIVDGLLFEDAKRDLFSALNTLGEPEREIFIRRYYYEQKPKDISVAVNLTVKQVNNYLYRTKQKLREAIAGK